MKDDESDRHNDLRGAKGVMIGHHNVQFNQFDYPVPRSDYHAQVRQMAPADLLDRSAELAELTDFCTGPGTGGYLLWSAEAWAGKTALMLSFAASPPPGIRVVSFFVTGRLAAQNNREAFLDIVIEQLAEILNEQVPPISTPATRPSHFWRMLDEAAVACAEQGRRLVLIVDGLDEDLGAADHSIAALLPRRPSAGLRIVLAARPNPPFPDDVSDDHPLRDPGIVRALEPSPHARVIKREAERDLKRLLTGTTVEQDLLGLVVASGGGLSGQDLAELTGDQPWRIDECLGTVTGRAFARRPADWSKPAADRELYILAHEELQRTAVRFIGDARLGEYRRRLHTWADAYRSRHWPTQTPEYLLRGYFRMIQADADLPRMIDCAQDAARHDRMLDMSGGDAAAFTEIANTQNAILDQDAPDLPVMVRIGAHHTNLTSRNAEVPAALPATWARLGRPSRAETMARAISNRRTRLSAWGHLMCALAERGDHDRARSILTETIPEAATAAGKDAHSILADLAVATAKAGQPSYAEELAAQLPPGELSIRALAATALAWVAVGDTARARAMADDVDEAAHRCPDPATAVRVRIRTQVAGVWAGVGENDRARTVAVRIEEIARRDMADERTKDSQVLDDARVLAEVGRAWTSVGDIERAKTIADEISRLAEDLAKDDSSGYAVWALHEALRVWVGTGDLDWTARLANVLIRQDRRRVPEDFTPGSAYVVADVAVGWAAEGHVVRAEEITRAITDPDQDEQSRAKVRALSAIVWAWARSGDTGCAHAAAEELEKLAGSISWPRDRVNAIASAADAWIEAGNEHRAEALARQAGELARTVADVPKISFVIDPTASAQDVAAARANARQLTLAREKPADAADVVLRAAAPAAARIGKTGRAATIAGRIDDATSGEWALAASKRMAARAVSSRDRVGFFDEVVRSITLSNSSAWTLEDFTWGPTSGTRNVGPAGDYVGAIVALAFEAWDLVSMAQVAAGRRDVATCRVAADAAVRFVQDIPALEDRARAASEQAELWRYATPGDISRAESLVRWTMIPDDRAWGLAGAVRALVVSGVFSLAKDRVLVSVAAVLKAWVLAGAAAAWIVSGDDQRAHGVARAIERFARATQPATARTLVLAISAKAWRDTGNPDRARALAQATEDTARAIDSAVEQGWALGDAALAWTWAGDAGRAESVTRTIDDLKLQAVGLLRLARQSETDGDALIAQALRLVPDGWPAAVDALVTLRPTVLLDTAEQLLADRR